MEYKVVNNKTWKVDKDIVIWQDWKMYDINDTNTWWMSPEVDTKDYTVLRNTWLKDSVSWSFVFEWDNIIYDLYWDWQLQEAVVPKISNQTLHWFGEFQGLVDDWYLLEIKATYI